MVKNINNILNEQIKSYLTYLKKVFQSQLKTNLAILFRRHQIQTEIDLKNHDK